MALSKSEIKKRHEFYDRQLKTLHKWVLTHPQREGACFGLVYGDAESDTFKLFAIAPSIQSISQAITQQPPEMGQALYGVSLYAEDGSEGYCCSCSLGWLVQAAPTESSGDGASSGSSSIELAKAEILKTQAHQILSLFRTATRGANFSLR